MDDYSRSAWTTFARDAGGIGTAKAVTEHAPAAESDLYFTMGQTVTVLCQLKAPGSPNCIHGLYLGYCGHDLGYFVGEHVAFMAPLAVPGLVPDPAAGGASGEGPFAIVSLLIPQGYKLASFPKKDAEAAAVATVRHDEALESDTVEGAAAAAADYARAGASIARSPSSGASMRRSPSGGASLGREPSGAASLRREASGGGSLRREASGGGSLLRVPSGGASVSRTASSASEQQAPEPMPSSSDEPAQAPVASTVEGEVPAPVAEPTPAPEPTPLTPADASQDVSHTPANASQDVSQDMDASAETDTSARRESDSPYSIYEAYYRDTIYEPEMPATLDAGTAGADRTSDERVGTARVSHELLQAMEPGAQPGALTAPRPQTPEREPRFPGQEPTPSSTLRALEGDARQPPGFTPPAATPLRGAAARGEMTGTPSAGGMAATSMLHAPDEESHERALPAVPEGVQPPETHMAGVPPTHTPSPLGGRRMAASPTQAETPQQPWQRLAATGGPRTPQSMSQSSSMLGSPHSHTRRSHDTGSPSLSSEAQLFQRWAALLTDYSAMRSHKKARALLLQGVPSALRGRIWLMLVQDTMRIEPGVYARTREQCQQYMAQPESAAFSRLIEQDLDRCFPHSQPFTGHQGSTRDDLRAVLYAYAHRNPQVGYTEGMCLVAGLLLTHLSPENAFWLLDTVVREYGLEGYYTRNMRQLHIDCDVLNEMLGAVDPPVQQKLQAMGVEPHMFLSGWVLPVYVRVLPWHTLLRFWDFFLCDGHDMILRTALAIIRINRHILLDARCSDMAETLHTLVFPPSPLLAPDRLLAVALQPLELDLRKMVRRSTRQVQYRDPSQGGADQQRSHGLGAQIFGKPMSQFSFKTLVGRTKLKRG